MKRFFSQSCYQVRAQIEMYEKKRRKKMAKGEEEEEERERNPLIDEFTPIKD